LCALHHPPPFSPHRKRLCGRVGERRDRKEEGGVERDLESLLDRVEISQLVVDKQLLECVKVEVGLADQELVLARW